MPTDAENFQEEWNAPEARAFRLRCMVGRGASSLGKQIDLLNRVQYAADYFQDRDLEGFDMEPPEEQLFEDLCRVLTEPKAAKRLAAAAEYPELYKSRSPQELEPSSADPNDTLTFAAEVLEVFSQFQDEEHLPTVKELRLALEESRILSGALSKAGDEKRKLRKALRDLGIRLPAAKSTRGGA